MDSTPHIRDPRVTWRYDPQVFKMHMYIWKKYMNTNENILTIIVQGFADIPPGTSIFDKDNHILKVHIATEHSYENPLYAVNFSLEAFDIVSKNFKYDFLIRAQTSSFWVFNRLEKLLLTLPKSKLYKGTKMFHDEDAISGSGFILSKDVVNLIVKGRGILRHTAYWDDVIFSRYTLLFDIPLEDMKICNVENIDNLLSRIEDADKNDVCQFKVKNSAMRLECDTIVLDILYNRYYNKNE